MEQQNNAAVADPEINGAGGAVELVSEPSYSNADADTVDSQQQ